MKQTLQLKISQSLTMTPQLQQAIRLLQLSSLDLQSEIQEILDANPLLEADAPSESVDKGFDEDLSSPAEVSSEQSRIDTDTSEKIQSDKLDEEFVIDTQWEDWGYVSQGSSSHDPDHQFDYQGETSESLKQQLQWQIDMMNLSDVDHAIATILIDSIDDRGYMLADLNEVIGMFVERESDSLSSADSEISIDDVQMVLHLIQSFEPAGIAARNLQECLLLQLKRLVDSEPSRSLAVKIVEDEFQALSTRNYRQITRALSIDENQLKLALDLIQSLSPRPGSQLSSDHAQYVTPDVFVRKDSSGEWTVELNNSCTPKLKINSDYAGLIKRADNSPDNMYLKNNLQEAKWFIKSLQSRNETLLKVSACIVSKQVGFFEYGEEAMKPLVLADIATEVEMHESTISRVTTQKYMHTPRGIFELKYFFSSHVGTSSGGECSSTAIRAVIKKLIAAENEGKPLSDSKLASLLKDQGINVARRTVAKYREAMSIPPSNERKKLI